MTEKQEEKGLNKKPKGCGKKLCKIRGCLVCYCGNIDLCPECSKPKTQSPENHTPKSNKHTQDNTSKYQEGTFNLSNYIEPESHKKIVGELRNYPVLPVFKVKEAVRLLKEEFDVEYKQVWGIHQIKEIIDAIFGRKLI